MADRGIPMAAIMKNSDILVAIGIVLVVVMMIVPLPTILLDLLLALQITLSLVILLVSMYTLDALQFSVFPSLLLVVTLFRLALNVSSTRLILLQGPAFDSRIIRAFGEFVISGNYVVGIVIFLILVVIQFIVITRGASRVAEVAARFTLDAMPGKQMSIDADFNAGIITDAEARARRLELQREADFYGAMDGASKFVQGDAIAGIVITIINILGGLTIGVLQHNLSLAESASIFTLLTVGDGLVSQIPALLVSTATGLVVTRASSDVNLGSNILKEMTAEPKALMVASGALLFLGMIPGLPKVAFFTLSAITGALAYGVMSFQKIEREKKAEEAKVKTREEVKKPENVVQLLVTDPMEIELGYSLVPLVDPARGGNILERIAMLRRQIALELGLVIPPIRVRDNLQFKPDVYCIKIKGQEVATGELKVGFLLAMNPGHVTKEIEGIETREPAFGLPAIWIFESQREEAEIAGYMVADVSSVLTTHLTEVIKQHAHEILGRQDVSTIINTIKESQPDLVAELTGPSGISAGELQKVLQNLLREGVSIRNMIVIFEALVDAVRESKNIEFLTEKVRQALGRQITRANLSADGVLNVITMDPALEEKLSGCIQQADGGGYLLLEPSLAQKIMNSVLAEVKKATAHGYQPVALVAPAIRPYFRKFVEKIAPKLTVMSYNEIVPPGQEVRSIGFISI